MKGDDLDLLMALEATLVTSVLSKGTRLEWDSLPEDLGTDALRTAVRLRRVFPLIVDQIAWLQPEVIFETLKVGEIGIALFLGWNSPDGLPDWASSLFACGEFVSVAPARAAIEVAQCLALASPPHSSATPETFNILVEEPLNWVLTDKRCAEAFRETVGGAYFDHLVELHTFLWQNPRAPRNVVYEPGQSHRWANAHADGKES